MRVRYRTCFRLGSPGAAPALADVQKECLSWALTRAPSPIDVPPDGDLAPTPSGPDTVTTIYDDRGDRILWGLRQLHPDDTDESVRWVTDLILDARADGSLWFSCTNAYGTIDGRVMPTRRAPSRPRPVYAAVRRWRGWRNYELTATPLVIADRENAIDSFVAMLSDPARTRPVVMISATNWDDRPVVDPRGIAEWLAGVAHVWVAANRFPSIKLKSRMPPSLNCWDGAVRIYWPGFSPYADPFAHELWRPEEIREVERGKHGLKERLLGAICAAAAHARDPEESSWEDMESARRHAAMRALQSAGSEKEFLQLVLEDNDQKDKQIEALRLQMRDLSAAHGDARRAETYWRQQFEVLKSGVPDDEGSSPPPAPDPESVAEAVQRATERFDQRLVFAPNGKSEIAENPFEGPADVFRALEFLATSYWESKTRGGEPDFDIELRERCGFFYRGAMSKVTMGKYSAWYATKWNGKEYWLGKHVGTGSSKDPRYTIRIAFEWDGDAKRVIIGFIGQHQETDAT